MESGIIIITGASSGIGEGFARAFAARGHRLLLVARRGDRLEALCRELGPRAHFWVGDLREPETAARLVEHAGEKGWEIAGLVNNAGFGLQAGLVHLPPKDLWDMIQLNVGSLVALTRLVLPGMQERRSGFILNIASNAAFQPVPYLAVYAATKAFVVSFTEAVSEEARPHGVFVGCLCPGPVDTEFREIAGMHPRFFARSQSPDEVVRAGLRALDRRKVVAWTAFWQEVASFGLRFLPRLWVRRGAARLMRWSGAERPSAHRG